MNEVIDRIVELRRMRDEVHEEICELERRLALLSEVAGTVAEDAVRDVFRERDRMRETGPRTEWKARVKEADDGTADAGTDGTRDSGISP